jgi:hypothetical protein
MATKHDAMLDRLNSALTKGRALGMCQLLHGG